MSNPSHPRKSRRWIFIPFALFIILALIYTAFWAFMRAELDKGIEQWMADERARGATIEYNEKQLTGFPFRFALHLTDPVYAAPEGVRWEGDELQLIMQPWNWQHVIGRAPGRNLITDQAGLRHTIVLGPKSVASLSWTADGINRFGLQLDDAEALIDGETYEAQDLSLNLAPAPDSKDDLRIALQWQELQFPEPQGEAAFLGRAAQPSRLIGKVERFFPAYASVGGDLERLPDALIRQGGGLDIGQLVLNVGPVKFGAMADLDAQSGMVEGDVSIRLEEVAALREALDGAGQLSNEINAGLTMVEAASQDGKFLTLTVKENGLYMLGNRVTDLPIGANAPS